MDTHQKSGFMLKNDNYRSFVDACAEKVALNVLFDENDYGGSSVDWKINEYLIELMKFENELRFKCKNKTFKTVIGSVNIGARTSRHTSLLMC